MEWEKIDQTDTEGAVSSAELASVASPAPRWVTISGTTRLAAAPLWARPCCGASRTAAAWALPEKERPLLRAGPRPGGGGAARTGLAPHRAGKAAAALRPAGASPPWLLRGRCEPRLLLPSAFELPEYATGANNSHRRPGPAPRSEQPAAAGLPLASLTEGRAVPAGENQGLAAAAVPGSRVSALPPRASPAPQQQRQQLGAGGARQAGAWRVRGPRGAPLRRCSGTPRGPGAAQRRAAVQHGGAVAEAGESPASAGAVPYGASPLRYAAAARLGPDGGRASACPRGERAALSRRRRKGLGRVPRAPPATRRRPPRRRRSPPAAASARQRVRSRRRRPGAPPGARRSARCLTAEGAARFRGSEPSPLGPAPAPAGDPPPPPGCRTLWRRVPASSRVAARPGGLRAGSPPSAPPRPAPSFASPVRDPAEKPRGVGGCCAAEAGELCGIPAAAVESYGKSCSGRCIKIYFLTVLDCFISCVSFTKPD